MPEPLRDGQTFDGGAETTLRPSNAWQKTVQNALQIQALYIREATLE